MQPASTQIFLPSFTGAGVLPDSILEKMDFN
jgi:hypothetical protein